MIGLVSGFATTLAVAETRPGARPIASSESGWPQFRGPRRDGVCDERGLMREWPEAGPKLLWTATNLGRGWSSPAIAGDRLFITGDVEKELRILAFDLNGRALWKTTNGAAWKDQYPGARGSVACSGGLIYQENAHGRLACFDAKTGRELWAVNLLDRFEGQNLTWGLSECPVVDEQIVYATAGGRDALFVGLDKSTGDLVWKSEPLPDSEDAGKIENASYASPILVQFAGRKLLIGCALRHVVCADTSAAKLQWAWRMPTTYSVLALAPVLVGDAVFVTAPLGTGGHLLQMLPPAQPNGPVGVKKVWTTNFDTAQGGVVHLDGKLYGSFYSSKRGWAALDARTGEILHEAHEFAKGSVLAADGLLYALCEDGMMLLLEPGEKSFQVKGRFRFAKAGSRDAWAHPVIHQGRLYLRYHETLYCYDLSGR